MFCSVLWSVSSKMENAKFLLPGNRLICAALSDHEDGCGGLHEDPQIAGKVRLLSVFDVESYLLRVERIDVIVRQWLTLLIRQDPFFVTICDRCHTGHARPQLQNETLFLIQSGAKFR